MYTTAKNTQIVIALLKAHGIKRVIANPGATNIEFVGSVQNDPFFEVFSGIDERHSAYMACGMAAESGEPVVLSCTGATASRNYIPAMTEAYYRKLPVIALTSSQVHSHLGQLHPQMIDRTVIQNDIALISIVCPVVKDEDDFSFCEREVNRALLELSRHGGGPVHINLETQFGHDFTVTELPKVRKMERIYQHSEHWPILEDDVRIAIWIGSKYRLDVDTSKSIDAFARKYQAIVLTDWTSQYDGYGKITAGLICSQCHRNGKYKGMEPQLIIHLGDVSADYFAQGYLNNSAPVWRVSEDGDICDLLGRLEKIFEMPEKLFFEHYCFGKNDVDNKYEKRWLDADQAYRTCIPELPFCNNWIARELAKVVPEGASVHLGILSTVRSWSYLKQREKINGYCNTGGFGIDGNMSALVGASLVNHGKLIFGMFGDLSFFYDLNALGNRHIGANLRIVLVNNGQGGEFSLYNNPGAQFGEHTADYIAAGRHFGSKSRDLVKHYVTDLGFNYLSACDQQEFIEAIPMFVDESSDKPVLLECFVSMDDEIEAWNRMKWLDIPGSEDEDTSIRHAIGKHLPDGLKKMLRTIIP